MDAEDKIIIDLKTKNISANVTSLDGSQFLAIICGIIEVYSKQTGVPVPMALAEIERRMRR